MKNSIFGKLVLTMGATLVLSFMALALVLHWKLENNNAQTIKLVEQTFWDSSQEVGQALQKESDSIAALLKEANEKTSKLVLGLYEHDFSEMTENLAIQIYPLVEGFDYDGALEALSALKAKNNEEVFWIAFYTKENPTDRETFAVGTRSTAANTKMFSFTHPNSSAYLRVEMQANLSGLTGVEEVKAQFAKVVESNRHTRHHVEQSMETAATLGGESANEAMKLASRSLMFWMVGLMTGTFALAASMLIYAVRRIIMAKLRSMGNMVQQIAGGQLTLRLPIPANPDEMDAIANNINSMADSLVSTLRTITVQAESMGAVVTELDSVRLQLTRDSEQSFAMAEAVVQENGRMDGETRNLKGDIDDAAASIQQMESATGQLSQEITTISSAADQASQNVNTVAAAAEEMSTNISQVNSNLEQVNQSVNTVASAIEEMTASLNEVRSRCVSATEESHQVNTRAKELFNIMEQLSVSAAEIGKVVQVINSIADQTNMLALNAAIEAAGAGGAGMGFAVVANEVKELARQTATATKTISGQIDQIQENTRLATEAAQQTTEGIQRIDAANQEITHAVNEQNNSVQEIARSMEGVAMASSEVTRNAQQMEAVSQDVSRAAIEASSGVNAIARAVSTAYGAASQVAQAASSVQQRTQSVQNLAGQIATASAKVESMGRQALTLSTTMNGSIRHFDHLTQMVSTTSAALLGATDGVELGETLFDLKAAKQVHLAWLWGLEQRLNSQSRIDPKELGSGQMCEFGRWLISDQAKAVASPQLEELEQAHAQLHQQASALVEQCNSGHFPEAKQHLKACIPLREKFFELLDQVFKTAS